MELILLLAQATAQPKPTPTVIITKFQITQSYCSNYGGKPKFNPKGQFTHCKLTQEQNLEVQKDFKEKGFIIGRYTNP